MRYQIRLIRSSFALYFKYYQIRLLTILYLSTRNNPFPSSPLSKPNKSSSPRSSIFLTRSSISIPPRVPFPLLMVLRVSSHCVSWCSRIVILGRRDRVNLRRYIPIKSFRKRMARNPNVNIMVHNPFVRIQVSQCPPRECEDGVVDVEK